MLTLPSCRLGIVMYDFPTRSSTERLFQVQNVAVFLLINKHFKLHYTRFRVAQLSESKNKAETIFGFYSSFEANKQRVCKCTLPSGRLTLPSLVQLNLNK